MIGGKQEVFESVKDLLDDLSINPRFVEKPAGPAQVKALVNMVMNINTAASLKDWVLGMLGSTLKCFAKFFPRPVRILAF